MLLSGLSLQAQDVPIASEKLILTGGTLVTSPGSQSQNVGILIEDGLIKQVGNIGSHYDAITIKLDSLFIYPGFIAPLSHIGVRKPQESNETPKVE